jgi:hypothetical protein
MKSRRKRIKSLVLVGLVLVFALSLVSQAEAQNMPLSGEYAVVGEQTCICHWLVNPDNPTNPRASVYWTETSTVLGTTIFNNNGTGSAKVSLVEVIHPIYTPIPLSATWPSQIPPSALGQTSTSDISLQFSYVASAAGAITRTITPGTITGSFTSGSLVGKTFKFTPFTLKGFVSRSRETIVYASVPGQPDIIKVDIFNRDGSLYGRVEQNCTRSRVLTYMGK